MNETKEQRNQAERQTSEETPTTWQTPGFTVIDTALEVTAYSLNSR
jgi:coenzyme PQQ precursor peptide PqqA